MLPGGRCQGNNHLALLYLEKGLTDAVLLYLQKPIKHQIITFGARPQKRPKYKILRK